MIVAGISSRALVSRTGLRRAAAKTAMIALLAVAAGILLMVSQGLSPLIVYSGSMEPTIPTGSVLLVKPTNPENLYVGDVITVNRPEGLGIVTHRIQSMQLVDGRYVFQTKGDANGFPDPELFTLEHQAGRVVGHVSYLGYAIVYASSPLIRTFLIAVLVYAVLASSKRRGRGRSLKSTEGRYA